MPWKRWQNSALLSSSVPWLPRLAHTNSRAVAIMSNPINSLSSGVLPIIAAKIMELISGAVSFTAKPVSAYLSGSIRLTMRVGSRCHTRSQPDSQHQRAGARRWIPWPNATWRESDLHHPDLEIRHLQPHAPRELMHPVGVLLPHHEVHLDQRDLMNGVETALTGHRFAGGVL